MPEIHLVHDVLDKAIRDRERKHVGRVDGIVLAIRDGERPQVAYLESGGATLVRRLNAGLVRWASAIRRWWSGRDAYTTRIPVSAVTKIGPEISVMLLAEECPSLDWERWVCTHIIDRIPGGGGKRGRARD